MHGSIMMFLFAGPFAFGLANYLVPLQIGARDMAFPRLNLLSYWLYLGGGLVMFSGFLTAEGAADFGWFAYTPLSDSVRSPGLGGDLWIAGIVLTGLLRDPHRRQHPHHRVHHAGPGHDHVPDAHLHLEHAGHERARAAGLPRPHRGGVPAVRGPPPRRARLRRRRRRRAHPVAAPLLVVRASGGVHPRPAVLRDHHRDLRGVLPAPGVRLPGPRPRHARHRRPVHGRVGPPHVRDGRRAPAVLQRAVAADRRAHRGEVLQLDRHDVGRPAQLRHPDALRPRLPAACSCSAA